MPAGQLGADQHRVQAADEEEQPDAPQVLDADDLVVGAETEVAVDAGVFLLSQRRRITAQAGERVVEEAEADEEADDAADVREVDGQLVVVDVGEVADAQAGDRMGSEPAHIPATDAEDGTGEEVEAEQAAPERRARLGDGGGGHPALLSGAGRYECAYGAPPSDSGLSM